MRWWLFSRCTGDHLYRTRHDHTGKEILVGSNENEIVIADVSDKANPTILSTIAYSNIGYTHQGWFTEDLNYFIVGDELDEQKFGNNTRTLVFDLSDLDNSYCMTLII